MKNKKEKILKHLQKSGVRGLTAIESKKLFKNRNLGNMIYILRQEGHNIQTMFVNKSSRYFMVEE